MDLSVIIVTYNSARLIDPLLTALQDQLAGLAAEVLVIDNASKDATVETVRTRHPWVRLIASPENLGFAAGNNRAIAEARGRMLLLLNPDAVPDAGALAEGLKRMDAHPEVGLSGGQLRGADGSPQPSARMFPTLRDELFTLSGLAAKYQIGRARVGKECLD